MSRRSTTAIARTTAQLHPSMKSPPAPAFFNNASVARLVADKPLTYADSGVDIAKEDKAVDALAGMLNFARDGIGAPIGTIGHFAGLVEFGEHALCLCTDGVGSKVEIANAIKKWDTVGIDCMAMNVNDALCVGAEPIAFVDYLAVEDPDPEFTKQVGAGLERAAEMANVSMVGGETASLPGIIKGFDLAGTCLAFAKKSDLVTGEKIAPGDVMIGLASSGIHSNGYTLARAAFDGANHAYTDVWPFDDAEHTGKSIGEVLLEPTRIYVREIMRLLKDEVPVHGLSHVTGSGLRKIRRINQNVAYYITDPLPIHSVFTRIQELGNVADHEMYKTFNMGMGFVVVVPKEHAAEALRVLQKATDYEVKIVGDVRAGAGVHHPIGLEH
jgi:phosphoribosylformylglycinamidine cyclo-ligase